MNKALLLLLLFISSCLHAQIVNHTGFESWSDEHEYLQTSWQSDGFNPKWVNGFDQGRAFIDNAAAATGSNSLRITYPAGTYGPGNNGAQVPLLIPGRDQYYVSYWLLFGEDFDWGGTSEGGKLPGLAGGANCSGCKTCDGTNGFSARLMWRPGGRGVLYLYHMDKSNTCGDNLDLKDKSGNTVYFQKGSWYNIIQRVKVNSGSNNDGEVEIWINGDQALLVTGIQFVTNGDKVDNFYFSTFHGGGDAGWAPSITCYSWFDDIKISENPDDIFSGSSGTANVPPSVALTAPLEGVIIPPGQAVSFSADALDQDGVISKVDFYADNVLLGSATGSPYDFIWNSPNPGIQQVYALATDDSSASTSSAKAEILIRGTEVKYTPTTITASSHDGNIPENMNDGDLTTRWSAEGIGQWLQYDLGEPRTLNYLLISFYNGASRNTYFAVEVSEDGVTWTEIVKDTSRIASGFQFFDMKNVQARYVRYVGGGNSTNLWNSLEEMEIWGPDIITAVSSGLSGFALYPNPANDKFFLSNPDKNQLGILIKTLEGEVILQKNASDHIVEILTDGFPTGIYFVLIQTGDSVFVKKLILN